MATIDWPPSPIVGQPYVFGGRTWQWNGSGWMRVVNANQVVSVFIGLVGNLDTATALPSPIDGSWTGLVHL